MGLPRDCLLGRATNLAVDRKSAEDSIGMEIRFAGESLRVLPRDCQLRLESDTIRGELNNHKLTKTETGDWILTASVRPDGKEPVELSWQLFVDGQAVSEQFRYLLPSSEPEFVYPAVYTRQE